MGSDDHRASRHTVVSVQPILSLRINVGLWDKSVSLMVLFTAKVACSKLT